MDAAEKRCQLYMAMFRAFLGIFGFMETELESVNVNIT